MSAKISELKLPAVLVLVVGGVWMLGSLRAELDLPFSRSLQAEPPIVEGFTHLAAPEHAGPAAAAAAAEPHFVVGTAGLPRRISLTS